MYIHLIPSRIVFVLFKRIGFAYFYSFAFNNSKATISLFPILIIFLIILPVVLLLIGLVIARSAGRTISGQIIVGVTLWGPTILCPHAAFFVVLLNIVNNYRFVIDVTHTIHFNIHYFLCIHKHMYYQLLGPERSLYRCLYCHYDRRDRLLLLLRIFY